MMLFKPKISFDISSPSSHPCELKTCVESSLSITNNLVLSILAKAFYASFFTAQELWQFLNCFSKKIDFSFTTGMIYWFLFLSFFLVFGFCSYHFFLTNSYSYFLNIQQLMMKLMLYYTRNEIEKRDNKSFQNVNILRSLIKLLMIAAS